MGSLTNIILLLIFFTLFFLHAHSENALVDSSSDSRCIESERNALLEFKNSLKNDSNVLSSWVGHDCCSWLGITCHNLTGHILNLELDHGYQYDLKTTINYFNSPLSPWLFNLTQLQVLSLCKCDLRGPIPNMFHKLPSLTHLCLSHNAFDSAVFPDSLCSLTSLTQIYLVSSQLQGSLPSCLGNLTFLTELYLYDNELSGEIPDGLGHLPHLTDLDLSDNHFISSIPSSFGHLERLEFLDLYDNQLSGPIPSALGNLSKLVSLNIRDNLLTGELSESFFKGLTTIQRLVISRNHYLFFNVSPYWIPNVQLHEIDMDSISIGTQFPPWLCTQRKLERLVMSNASISGSIPKWCQTAFPDLRTIVLSKNLLNGFVPIFDSVSLEFLQLSGNQFSGEIPEHLCNLTSLLFLSLANNKITGRIPSCLGISLRNLNVLDLGNNILSGHIPSELGSIRYLLDIHLNGNKFFGELPMSLQNLGGLTTLDLGENDLEGSIPQWIGKNYFPHIQNLRLESNKFSGNIPVNLCQLSSLQILNLALNNLVGTIPSCIGNLSAISSVDKYGNWLRFSLYTQGLLNIIKGKEMEYTSSLRYAKFISLSGNQLSGEIPVELMDLKGLQSLNLSNNELTGIIPENINNLMHLESLDLSMNRLSGTIPQSLADIDALSYLNLSFNNLAGRVPSGNHFDTLNEPSIYEGNKDLCGNLLMKSCPGDSSPNGPISGKRDDTDEEFEFLWLCAGIGPGYAVGFLGVVFILYLKRPWRIALFRIADNVYDEVLWVTLTIKISQFRTKFK